MRWLVVLATDQIDEFLEGAGSGARLGEQLGTVGASIAVPALLVAVGLLTFVRYVHDGSRQEQLALSRVLKYLGVLTLIGGLVEVYGARLVVGESWFTDLLGGTLRGGVMRAVAGVGMILGFGLLRDWAKGYVFGVAGAGVGVLSLTLTGHTIAEGNPILLIPLDVVHVVTGGIWLGGLAGLVLVFAIRRSAPTGSLTPMVVRFSGLATLALVAVTAAGVGMSFLMIDSPVEYLGTTWGRVLLIKVGLVVVAGAIGGYNHFVVVPGLRHDPDEQVLLRRARVTVTCEAMILIGVALMSVLLTEAPIN